MLQKCNLFLIILFYSILILQVFIVIEETASELDKLLFSTPLMKTMGDQVTVKVTSLLGYEAFTNNLNEMRGDATR